jgi:hypothetical protein
MGCPTCAIRNSRKKKPGRNSEKENRARRKTGREESPPSVSEAISVTSQNRVKNNRVGPTGAAIESVAIGYSQRRRGRKNEPTHHPTTPELIDAERSQIQPSHRNITSNSPSPSLSSRAPRPRYGCTRRSRSGPCRFASPGPHPPLPPTLLPAAGAAGCVEPP